MSKSKDENISCQEKLDKAMKLLSQVESGIDEWNFPIMCGEEVRQILDDYYGEGVRPE